MTIHQEGPFGANGGKDFKLGHFTSIDKIGVAYTIDGSNSIINGITIDYTDDKGVHHSVKFGGLGGDSGEFGLQAGEYIKSIEFYCGSTSEDTWSGVRDIAFVTSNNYHHYGNNKVGQPFKLPVNNGTIVGFLGRVDEKGLVALGAYVEDGHTGGSTGTGF